MAQSQRGPRRRKHREWIAFAAFVAPNLVVFAAFTFWPILYSFYLSLQRDTVPGGHSSFAGLQNYIALFHDGDFWMVLANTLFYALSVVLIAQTLAFLLALLLNRAVPGRAVFRTIAFTPYVTTTVAAAMVWVLLLDPRLGPLSLLYHAFGIEGPHWLASPRLALWALILVGSWKEIAFATVFFLAGLQGLPADVYEAALIEGASAPQRLRHLTLPLTSPVIFFLAITGFIAATKAFDIVAIMTQGGPVYPDSSMYVYHLYRLAFRQYRFGYASAFAVVFFVATLVLILVKFRIGRRYVHYEE